MMTFSTESAILFSKWGHRDLGVEVDRDLKFYCHISDLVCKATGLSRNLSRSTINRN